MTKSEKMFRKLVANPSLIIRFRDFEGLLRDFGFIHERTTGSHRHHVHPDVQEILTVSPDGKDANRYQVRRFLAMVREHSLSIEQ